MNHPFHETFIVGIQFRVLGVTVSRRLRVTSDYTPDWPFIDPETWAETTAKAALSLNLEILARPQSDMMTSDQRTKHQPYWTPANDLLKSGVLNCRVYKELHESIDACAHIDDLVRRHKLKIQTTPSPRMLSNGVLHSTRTRCRSRRHIPRRHKADACRSIVHRPRSSWSATTVRCSRSGDI